MGKGKLTLINQEEQIQQIQQIVQPEQTKKIKKKKKKNKHKENTNLIEQINNDINYHNQKNNNVDNIQHPQPFKRQNQENIQDQQKVQNNREIQEQIQQQKIKIKHLAIAIPDSILQLPQTSQLRSYFISQIARISSIFKVDQIIILKDHAYISKSQNFYPSQYMARNLQYLQTPQYLRKHLFKLHADLKNAGIMNPIEAQHHLKTDQLCQFRQGVALDRPAKKGSGSWVDVGLKKQAKMDQLVLPLTRVTLRLKNFDDQDAPYYQAQAISKKVPRMQHGLYWGYDVRIAKNLHDMFDGSKSSLNENQYNIKLLCNHTKETYSLPQIQHFYQIAEQLKDSSVLIFFSGTDDLQAFIEKDLRSKITKQDAVGMFDCCMKFEGVGVKKLRIQQQLFITLSKICEYTY